MVMPEESSKVILLEGLRLNRRYRLVVRVQIHPAIWQKYLFCIRLTCRDNSFDTLCIKIIVPTFCALGPLKGSHASSPPPAPTAGGTAPPPPVWSGGSQTGRPSLYAV